MADKYTIEEIKVVLRNKGFRLLDDEYVSVKDKHNIQDSEGFKYYVEFSNFIGGRMPERFRPTNPYTIENINHLLHLRGSKSKVISEEYTGAREKIKVICGECGEVFETVSNHIISRGQSCCPKCSLAKKGMRHRVPIEVVKAEFEKSGLTPLFDKDDYKGDSYKLPCLDSEGNMLMVTYRALRQYNRNGAAPYVSNVSKIECLTKEHLEEIGVRYDTQVCIDGCRYKQGLLFDFRVDLDNGKWFLIEADGLQHYKYCEYFYGDKETGISKYEESIKRDSIKDEFCKRNNIPLLRIPYYLYDSETYKTKINEMIFYLQNAAV